MTREELKERAEAYTNRKIEHLQNLYPNVEAYGTQGYRDIIFEEALHQIALSEMWLERSKDMHKNKDMHFLLPSV